MRYLARRGAFFLVTLWAALTVNFIIPRVMPGNEAAAVLGTFRGVNPAALHARLLTQHPGGTELSAGMSGDLEVAIRHGSTCVRVGTALLGQRPLTSP